MCLSNVLEFLEIRKQTMSSLNLTNASRHNNKIHKSINYNVLSISPIPNLEETRRTNLK